MTFRLTHFFTNITNTTTLFALQRDFQICRHSLRHHLHHHQLTMCIFSLGLAYSVLF